MLSTRQHGFIDYFYGIFLTGMPWIFHFPEGIVSTLPIVFGIFTILLSVFTNYEAGWLKIIPFKVHLGIDMIAGLVIMFAPWLFRFPLAFMLPFVLTGLFSVLISILTITPRYKKNRFLKGKRTPPDNALKDPGVERAIKEELEG